MANEPSLILIGASVRAAAFSALRAGLRPWCADLYADRDLSARLPARRIARGRYPTGFRPLLAQAPGGPWMYTGRLEDRPDLIGRILAEYPDRPLWGNHQVAVKVVRSPQHVHALLSTAGLPCPAVCSGKVRTLRPGEWVQKGLKSSGGLVQLATDPPIRPLQDCVYLQEYIRGQSHGAVYVALPGHTRLLGVTVQLHRGPMPFVYSGSIGPVRLPPQTTRTLRRIGEVLATGAGLRGLFGIDFILRDNVPWPVEVNPRYTASIEVLEYACGLKALAWHLHAFGQGPLPDPPGATSGVVGKSIYHCRQPLTFPAEGPWMDDLRADVPLDRLPGFADIPAAGETFHPYLNSVILTHFARGDSVASCLDELTRVERHLDSLLGQG